MLNFHQAWTSALSFPRLRFLQTFIQLKERLRHCLEAVIVPEYFYLFFGIVLAG
jgi:hypothetical protein